MKTMRAIRFHEVGPPEVLRLEEAPAPEPGAGEVLVQVRAVGVNYSETRRRRGLSHPPTSFPAGLGSEAAGTVAALGDGVAGLSVGQRVMAMGGENAYAEYTVAPADHVLPLPDAMSFEEGAAFPVQGLTAFHVLHTFGGLRPGQSVLITAAAGGVGTLAVQLAKMMGAGLVVAAASTEAKLDLARSLGADTGVNYGEQGWQERVREATGGRGVDLILESVGGDIFHQAMEALAPLGRVVLYGSASGVRPNPSGEALLQLNASVTGFQLGNLRRDAPDVAREGVDELLGYLAAGRVRLVIGHRFPLERAAAAHAAMESRTSTGKIVLTA